MGNNDFRSIGGESIVLCVMAGYLLVSCVRNGIWDRKLQPNLKTNTLLSVVSGVAVGGFHGIRSYCIYHALAGSLATFVISSLSTGIMCLVALTIVSHICKKRRYKLDEQVDREDQEV